MVGTGSEAEAREPRAAPRTEVEALREVIDATIEMAVKVRSEAATALLRRAGALLRERGLGGERPFRPS